MRSRMRTVAAAALTLAAAMGPGATATAAGEGRFAPAERPGPGIGERAELTCTDDVRDARRAPVLLNPATGVTVEENFEWNYMRAFRALGIPYCAYHAPNSTLDDIQASGELLVDAIRRTHRLAGRRIAIVGHSQGGMSMRWALRFWPDTRAMVDDVIGFAGSNHGTTQGDPESCAQYGCPPAVWQQDDGARFIRALNSRAETFAETSYTSIYTRTDEVVTPPESSELRTGSGRVTNVATQDVCPADPQSHLFIGTTDPVAYALTIDALDHDGPADPARIDRAVCAQAFQPGIDPANLDNFLLPLRGAPGLVSTAAPGANTSEAPSPKAEPPLRCYVKRRCADRQQVEPGAKTCTTKRRFTSRLPRGLSRLRATVARRRATVRRGRFVRVDLRGRGTRVTRLRVTAVRDGEPFKLSRRYRPCRASR